MLIKNSALKILSFFVIILFSNCDKKHEVKLRVINNSGEYVKNVRFNATPLNGGTSEFKIVESVNDNIFQFSTPSYYFEITDNLDLSENWDYSIVIEAGTDQTIKSVRRERE